jgi:hypothetical protein
VVDQWNASYRRRTLMRSARQGDTNDHQTLDRSAGGTTDKSSTTALTIPTVGDLLNTAGATWGWFNGGFRDCGVKHPLYAIDRLDYEPDRRHLRAVTTRHPFETPYRPPQLALCSCAPVSKTPLAASISMCTFTLMPRFSIPPITRPAFVRSITRSTTKENQCHRSPGSSQS